MNFFFKPTSGSNAEKQEQTRTLLANASLEDQLRAIVALPDEEYKDSLLTPELRKFIMEFEKEYVSTLRDYKTHIAPSYWEITARSFNVS